jgi:hypothetical protein
MGAILAGLHGQHGVDKQAITTRSRDAPRRCVRADNQAHLFEVRHHVANGGGGEFKPGGARQGAAANRLSVGYVALYQSFQQQLGTIIEHRHILVM